MKYWIFLHHKCASQYLRAQISAAGQAAKRLTQISALNSLRRAPLQSAMQHAMHITDYNLDDNAWPESVRILEALGTEWRGIELYRDPRDLLVSSYFSHKHSHGLDSLPGLRAHREALCAAPVEAGLLMDMEFYVTDQAIRSIIDWPHAAHVKRMDAIALAGSMAYGDLARFRLMMGWLDIPVGADFHAPTFQSLRPEVPHRDVLDAEENTHHYRHGVQGDHRRYFTTHVAEAFTHRYGTWP